MTKTTCLHCLQAVTVTCLCILSGCDYGRFKDQPSLRPYEIAFPDMPAEVIPITGGLQMLIETDRKGMQNPISYSEESVRQGAVKYGYYCIMCHGANADGNGTVGQSFSPLPTNLKEPAVQNQSDGELFYKITFGFNRHPPLAQTVAATGRWDIINFLRSLRKERSSLDSKRAGN